MSASIKLPELLAPAGNWECARAAVENGADAIYFGLESFNARMRAENFVVADLPELMAFLHGRGVKGYVTLNTLIFTDELDSVEDYLQSIIRSGVDAVIVQDVGICQLIRHLSPDFPIHGSTQMTITSALGVEFARDLGCNLVVLARECSIKEINRIQGQLVDKDISLPLEVFVHGALCVAYSGQCLTSEALGGRSANRGECAQACRMPYDLISDGEVVDLGDRRYLLSPQDLSGLEVLPELVKTGVTSLKIEGRLKSPEYVAIVTRIYRQALDGIVQESAQYQLEMAFSRGLSTGWFEGIDNQRLVHGEYGKKRGVYLGDVLQIHGEKVVIKPHAPLKLGDGVVFDSGHPEVKEEGGRIYAVEKHGQSVMIGFGRGCINWDRVNIGDRLWKTSDPELDRQIRQTYQRSTPQTHQPIEVEIYGELDQVMVAIARDSDHHTVKVSSAMVLVTANHQPLNDQTLIKQFSRLGNTPFKLGKLTNNLQGDLLLPISELNKMRREIVEKLEVLRSTPKRWTVISDRSYEDLLPITKDAYPDTQTKLIVLVRNLQQLTTVIDRGITHIYCEFEDPRKYLEAVKIVRENGHQNTQIAIAPPRITKPNENWILDQVKRANADAYLIRNYDHLTYFSDVPCIGDFSLNIANPITAKYFHEQFKLTRLTASYDLNIQQLTDLIILTPPHWWEITIHQYMPMFHMEHCLFCAFLSTGKDFTDCGRPCDKHQVKIRDRVGTEHILQADAGCRNTVFNGTAQTGAEYVHILQNLGITNFRIEFLNETAAEVEKTLDYYRQLLTAQITGVDLWKSLKLNHQLGVTRGQLRSRK